MKRSSGSSKRAWPFPKSPIVRHAASSKISILGSHIRRAHGPHSHRRYGAARSRVPGPGRRPGTSRAFRQCARSRRPRLVIATRRCAADHPWRSATANAEPRVFQTRPRPPASRRLVGFAAVQCAIRSSQSGAAGRRPGPRARHADRKRRRSELGPITFELDNGIGGRSWRDGQPCRGSANGIRLPAGRLPNVPGSRSHRATCSPWCSWARCPPINGFGPKMSKPPSPRATHFGRAKRPTAPTGVNRFLLGLAASLRLVQTAKRMDEGWAVRLSPLGRFLMGLAGPVALPTFQQTLLVQPNLEILAYRQGLTPELITPWATSPRGNRSAPPARCSLSRAASIAPSKMATRWKRSFARSTAMA